MPRRDRCRKDFVGTSDTVEAFASAKNESASGAHSIPQNKWVIDSDHALSNIRATSKMKGVTSAEYRLSQSRSGESLWTLSFFGDGKNPVARFQVGAKSGTAKILGDE